MSTTSPVRLCAVEEQEIYREMYKSALTSDSPIQLLEVLSNGDGKAIREAVISLEPDVLLLGTRKLGEEMIEELRQIRSLCPSMGLVILLLLYSDQTLKPLRLLALKGQGGLALFLKQSLSQVRQLCNIILAASQGQIILDPTLAASLLIEKPEHSFLKQLTARELEILSLIARGYTNAAIADALYIDIKTVEHHINSMYAKLRAETNFNHRHPRVSAARLYLEAAGELLPQHSDREGRQDDHSPSTESLFPWGSSVVAQHLLR